MHPLIWAHLSFKLRSVYPQTRSARRRFVCAKQLKTVRKQFNEHDTMKQTLLYMTVVLCSYPVIVIYLLADERVIERRVSLFCECYWVLVLLLGDGVDGVGGVVGCASRPVLPRMRSQ